MASHTIFSMRVIRCPACHARLPVDGQVAFVKCEYCDARVEIARRSGPPVSPPSGHPTQPTYSAAPTYSGVALILIFVPILVLGSAAIFAYNLWLHAAESQTSSPSADRNAATTSSPPSIAPSRTIEAVGGDVAAPADAPVVVGALVDPPPVDDDATPGAEPAPSASTGNDPPNAPGSKAPSRAASERPATPTGPVISVDEARKQLEPKARACMQTAKVHHILAYMGNKSTGAVKVLSDSRTRVDGTKVALAKTALGRCLDTAGETVRTAAFKSNYVRLDVRNDGVPDPLAHLPANPDMTEVRKLIVSFDPQVNACAAKHGVEGAREVFYFTIDGPTGTVMSVRGSYLSKAFKSCAEAIYKGAKFTKVRKAQYEMTYSLN